MPNDVIKHYHLTDLATPDGYVYVCETQKRIYGCWIYTTLQYGIIYIPTASHTMNHLGPLFILGQTGTNRATTFSLSQESNP